MTGFFDTNILIDFLNGISAAHEALAPFSCRCISRITWMEVMAGVKDSPDEDLVRNFLGQFDIIELSSEIAESAIHIRRHYRPKLKLPDAIILASARHMACRLITRNTKDFPEDSTDITVPYLIGD
jgi:predicted nucleic acid-binding protein